MENPTINLVVVRIGLQSSSGFCGQAGSQFWPPFPIILQLAQIVALAVLVGAIHCQAEDMIRAGEDCYSSGRMCFVTGTSNNTRIHLIRCGTGQIENVFTKDVLATVKPPMCFSDSIVAVRSDGLIYKLDLKGESVFNSKPDGFSGASASAGKVGEGRIYLTETVWNESNSKWVYRLYIVDVTGNMPKVESTHVIIQPSRVVRADGEIVVIGDNKISRIKIGPRKS